MRDSIFISHAAPEDNDFTRWLSLQLIGLGYKVWSDVIKLKGGEDWWPIIEKEIRENSVKFITVLSVPANNKDGVLKELAVAQKVKKQLNDEQFIIPIHVDSNLSHDDVNIELNRLNSISFKKSWAEGLKRLIELLEEHKVLKSLPNFGEVNRLWEAAFLQNKQPIEKQEIYSSNWFPIIEMPKSLRFHKIKYAIPKGFELSSLPYPIVTYRDYFATFAWCYDFMNELPKTTTYDQSQTIEIPVEEVLNGNFNDEFIRNRIAKNIVIQLLNKAFDKSLRKKPVSVYTMSNQLSFYVNKGVIEKDKFNKIQFVGKQKDKQWHFGISGSVKMFPERCFVINSHIWFTSDGINLIPESAKQHAARRKQGRNWWNNDWRSKTVAFVQYLAEEDEMVHLDLGSEEKAKFSMNPMLFSSPVTYVDPNIENLLKDDVIHEPDTEEEIVIDNELNEEEENIEE